MKYSDDKWFWNTIEEFHTLVLFDCLDKIHKYNEKLERIYTNEDNLSEGEIAVLVVVHKSSDTIVQSLETYHNTITQKHWPKIICDESTKWFCVFDDTTHTLV